MFSETKTQQERVVGAVAFSAGPVMTWMDIDVDRPIWHAGFACACTSVNLSLGLVFR